MTSKRIDALAERLADSVIEGFQRCQRAKGKAAATRRKRLALQQRLETLGTPKFKPSEGLYRAVADALGLNWHYVYEVAKGSRTSKGVLKALREEIGRRALSESGAPRVAAASNQQSAVSKGGAQ